MPVTIHEDQTLPYVLIYEFSGNWTDVEFRVAIDEAAGRAQMFPADARQDGIAVLHESTRSLLGVNPFEMVGYVRRKLPERGGCMVVVFDHSMVESILSLLNKLIDRNTQRIFHRSSLQAARELIAELRAEDSTPVKDSLPS